MYAGSTYAGGSYDGDQPHDLPTVTNVTVSPGAGTVVNAAYVPNVGSFRVGWTYAQAQGVPQASYRIEILNAALTVTYYDSGWIGGNVSVGTVPTDAIPTDTTGTALRARVSVSSSDGPGFASVSPTKSFDIQFGVVTASITSPVDGSAFLTPVSGVTVVWTGSPDSRGNVVKQVRLRLIAADSGFVFADTGFTFWTSGSSSLVYGMTSGSHYKVELTLKNGNGVLSAPVNSSFWYMASSESAVTPCPDVGTRYEVGVNGVGYMLFDGNTDVGSDIRSELLRRTRDTKELNPPRLSTSQTPFNEAIDKYSFFGGADYRGGVGQLQGDRTSSDDTAFSDSDGINPFVPHQFSLLKTTSQEVQSSWTAQRMALAGDVMYVQSAASSLKYQTVPGGASTTLAITKGGAVSVTISDLASDGQKWYAAAGTDGILRGNTTDPGAVWSSIAATLVRWAGDRVCAAYPGTGSSTANVFTTFTDAGLEEVPGGRMILTPGTVITDVTSGGGFIWFTAYSGDQGTVYKWGLTAGTPSVAWPLPVGQVPTAIRWYQGEIVVRAKRSTSSTTTDAILYIASLDSTGNLNPSLLCTLVGGTGEMIGTGTFGVNDRFVFFNWGNHGDGHAGLGAIDLSSGGYCRWLKGPTQSNPQVRSIIEWHGRTFFSVDLQGTYSEHATNYVASGYLRTSLHDGASGVDKIWDRVLMQFQPLPSGSAVTLKATYDGGNSYSSVPGFSVITGGQTQTTVDLGQRAMNAGMEITLAPASGSPVSSPVVTVWQMQCHPVGKADLTLQLPINCADFMSDMSGTPLPENGSGAGTRRSRLLESLQGQRVLVQDVDWLDSKASETFEITEVRRIPIPAALKEAQTAKTEVMEVALVTFTRSFR